MKAEETLVGRKEIAEVLGISEREVTNLVKQQPDFPSVQEGRSRKFPRTQCVRWYVRFKQEEAVKRAKPVSKENDDEIRKRTRVVELLLLEVEYAEREKQLLPADTVDQVVGEVCDRLRAVITNLRATHAMRLEEAGVDPAVADSVLGEIEEELMIALRGTADELEQLDLHAESPAVEETRGHGDGADAGAAAVTG